VDYAATTIGRRSRATDALARAGGNVHPPQTALVLPHVGRRRQDRPDQVQHLRALRGRHAQQQVDESDARSSSVRISEHCFGR
jgi:hypothetical protein